MKSIFSRTRPDNLLDICRTCSNGLLLERASVFEDIEIQIRSKESNQDEYVSIRILDIILLCTSNISVNIQQLVDILKFTWD